MFLVVVGLARERAPGAPDPELKGLRRVWMKLFRTKDDFVGRARKSQKYQTPTLSVGRGFIATPSMIKELSL